MTWKKKHCFSPARAKDVMHQGPKLLRGEQVGEVSEVPTAMLTLPRICSGILPAFFSD